MHCAALLFHVEQERVRAPQTAPPNGQCVRLYLIAAFVAASGAVLASSSPDTAPENDPKSLIHRSQRQG